MSRLPMNRVSAWRTADILGLGCRQETNQADWDDILPTETLKKAHLTLKPWRALQSPVWGDCDAPSVPM